MNTARWFLKQSKYSLFIIIIETLQVFLFIENTTLSINDNLVNLIESVNKVFASAAKAVGFDFRSQVNIGLGYK